MVKSAGNTSRKRDQEFGRRRRLEHPGAITGRDGDGAAEQPDSGRKSAGGVSRGIQQEDFATGGCRAWRARLANIHVSIVIPLPDEVSGDNRRRRLHIQG